MSSGRGPGNRIERTDLVEGREELVDGVRNAANLAAKSGGSEFVSRGGVFIGKLKENKLEFISQRRRLSLEK
jgi:hypothetical protein